MLSFNLNISVGNAVLPLPKLTIMKSLLKLSQLFLAKSNIQTHYKVLSARVKETEFNSTGYYAEISSNTNLHDLVDKCW